MGSRKTETEPNTCFPSAGSTRSDHLHFLSDVRILCIFPLLPLPSLSLSFFSFQTAAAVFQYFLSTKYTEVPLLTVAMVTGIWAPLMWPFIVTVHAPGSEFIHSTENCCEETKDFSLTFVLIVNFVNCACACASVCA